MLHSRRPGRDKHSKPCLQSPQRMCRRRHLIFCCNLLSQVLDEMPRKFGFRPNAAATLTWTVPVREQDATAAATAPIFRLCQVYTTLMSSCTWRLGKGINMADLQITTSAPLRNGRMDLAMTLLERMHQVTNGLGFRVQGLGFRD